MASQTDRGRRGGVRWVVREGDGGTVAEVVRRAGGDAAAIREGRVFVGRVRASVGEAAVAVGDVVTVAPAETVARTSVAILVDEDGLVGVDKPAGMPTIPDHKGSAHSLLAVVAEAIGCETSALHPTSRLDRDVSGVVVFARTPEAAARLARAREAGDYHRRYVAVSGRSPVPPEGAWDAPIGRAKDPRKRAVSGKDATTARSRYATVARADPYALLALEPQTGRTHQLRVHAAHAGVPLLGDPDYGGASRLTLASGRVLALRRIALHAARVLVPRSGGGAFDLRAEVPRELRELWSALGGEDDAWARSLSLK